MSMQRTSRCSRTLLPCLMIPLAVLWAEAGPSQARATTTKEEGLAVPLRFHLSERASFLHFVDQLSRWSPYCNPVDLPYLGIPTLGEADEVWLQRYAAARRPLGWRAQTDLFLWAEAGFPLEGRSPGHAEMKAAIDHFRAIPGFRSPLSRRMKEVESRRPFIDDEIARLQTGLKALRGVVDVFGAEQPRRREEVPLFVMYNFKPRSSGGGANGDGIFTELDLSASSADEPRPTHLLHEYLHLALRPRDRFKAFTAASPELASWQQALSSSAPDERGDNEAAMLDEILVHALANVVVEGRDPEGEIQNDARGGDKQRVRLWDGVRILLPLIRRQLEKPLPGPDFLSELIGAFMGQVHYPVWSCPEGITIAQSPPR